MKRFLQHHLPPAAYLALRIARHGPRRRPRPGAGPDRRALEAVLAAHGGPVVAAGPFAGMRYLRGTSWGDDLVPKLLGSYEAELHGEIERLVARGYRRVVNVGGAEGYYAVGLARRLPGAEVVVFDVDPRARHLCRRLARRNGVSGRVRIAVSCTAAELGALVSGPTLVVMDCEGCEAGLLRPDLAPGLAGADLVVELHDFLAPGVTEAVTGRFAATHDLVLVATAGRRPGDYPALAALGDAERRAALDEHRPAAMRWAVLRARRPA